MVLLKVTFTGSSLASASAPSCPLRSTDEITTSTSFRRRSGASLPAPPVGESKAEPMSHHHHHSSDEARSQASTTATSSPSMHPAVPTPPSACGAASPPAGAHHAQGQAPPGGTLGVAFSMDAAALAQGFPDPKPSPVIASWQSMIPSSAAAVPCDHANVAAFDELSYMRLDGEGAGGGGGEGMDLDGGWAEAGAGGGTVPRQEVLWPMRQLHRGFPDPGNKVLRTVQENEPQPVALDPFFGRPTHRGYPEPAERERFEQHVGEQFVRHYPVTPTQQIEGGGLSLVDDTEMAGLSWGYEQGEEMGTLQEHHGELGFLGGEEWGSE